MAKTFYTTDEAARKLQRTADAIKSLVREGKLREFRDGGAAAYKIEDVDRLASTLSPPPKPADVASASASGEIVLEPADDGDSDVGLGGSDVLTLASAESEDTAAGSPGAKKSASTGGTSVPSAGINVFDDDELDEMVDPLAQTAVTDVGGLGLEGTGSGSGILELTRESDDTSLGSELLEEIYTDKEEQEEAEPAGEATRAGMDEALTEPEEIGEEETAGVGAPSAATATGKTRAAARMAEEPSEADPVSTALTATMVVALAVLWVGALGATAMSRGFLPGMLAAVYANLMIFAGAALGVAAVAGGVTFFVVKRSK